MTPLTDKQKKAAQRARDEQALNRWVEAGCPKPPAGFPKWADVLKWIRKEYGYICLKPGQSPAVNKGRQRHTDGLQSTEMEGRYKDAKEPK